MRLTLYVKIVQIRYGRSTMYLSNKFRIKTALDSEQTEICRLVPYFIETDQFQIFKCDSMKTLIN